MQGDDERVRFGIRCFDLLIDEQNDYVFLEINSTRAMVCGMEYACREIAMLLTRFVTLLRTARPITVHSPRTSRSPITVSQAKAWSQNRWTDTHEGTATLAIIGWCLSFCTCTNDDVKPAPQSPPSSYGNSHRYWLRGMEATLRSATQTYCAACKRSTTTRPMAPTANLGSALPTLLSSTPLTRYAWKQKTRWIGLKGW